MSRKNGGEKYVKSFDGYVHLLTMLFAVIMRFDSLREIESAMTAEVRKLAHLCIEKVPKRSTLSDANARRSEKFLSRSIEASKSPTKANFHRTAAETSPNRG